jgi:GntR family transcriptional repressor for pyruvate dehydrogenase complex
MTNTRWVTCFLAWRPVNHSKSGANKVSETHVFRTVGDKSRLVDRVVNEVESLIVDGQLQPGMKLPPERELADQLGVSRTVVREAVHILVAKGLLDSKPGVGTIVRRMTTAQVVESLNLLLQTNSGGISFENLHQVRSMLEVEIAGLAAHQATETDLAHLQQIAADMKLLQSDPERFAAKDADFHRALAQTTHNPLLVVFLDSIRDLMQEYSALVLPYLDLSQKVMPFHNRILERVVARDAEGACQAMQEHLDQIVKNYEAVCLIMKS